jgi:hypothetical protein
MWKCCVVPLHMYFILAPRPLSNALVRYHRRACITNFSISHKNERHSVCRGLVSAMLTESMRPDSAPQRRVRLASDNEIEKDAGRPGSAPEATRRLRLQMAQMSLPSRYDEDVTLCTAALLQARHPAPSTPRSPEVAKYMHHHLYPSVPMGMPTEPEFLDRQHRYKVLREQKREEMSQLRAFHRGACSVPSSPRGAPDEPYSMAGSSVRPMPVAWMTDVGWAEDIASWRTAVHDSAVDASTNPFTEEAELLALEVASRRRAAPNISCRASASTSSSADGTSSLAVTYAVTSGVVADPDAAPGESAASRSKAVRSPRRTYLSKPAGSRSSAIAAAIDAGPASRAAERQADASEAAGIIRAMQQHARMMAAQSRVKYRAAPMLHTTHLVHEAEDGHWQSQKVGPVIERERKEEQARRVPTLDAWMARQWQRRPKLERKLNSSVGVAVREIISVSSMSVARE